MNYFIRGHVEAFSAFTAVPRVVLYDNLRSAMLERSGDAQTRLVERHGELAAEDRLRLLEGGL